MPPEQAAEHPLPFINCMTPKITVGLLALIVSLPAARFTFVVAADGRVLVDSGTSRPVEQATLFAFDDHALPLQENLRLEMLPPKKHSHNPVLPLGGPGMPDEWSVQFYGSILRHEGKFKMWYVAADEESFTAMTKGGGMLGWRPAYAESEDGIHWVKPNLGLVNYHGNKNNNLLLVEPAEARGLHLIVLHEPYDPRPERRFKMLITVPFRTNGRGYSTSIPLFSRDGFRWQMTEAVRFQKRALVKEDLFLPEEHFEQGGLFRWNGMYHLPGQQLYPWAALPDGRSAGRVMTILRSRDFLRWSPAKSLGFVRSSAFQHGGRNGLGEEAHLAASVWHRGNVLVGLYGLWHGAEDWQDRSMDLGLLVSNDGLKFREPAPDYVFIPRGKDGSWDQGGLLQGQGFANVGEQSYFYYGHWDMRVGGNYRPRGGVGLATLPRDRLGFLTTRQSNRPAAMITCALKVSGPLDVRINADGLSDDARLRVELLDESEQPIPGYSGGQAGRVADSGFNQPVSWAEGSSPPRLVQEFRVKLIFDGKERDRIKVYAIYVRSTDTPATQ